MLTITWDPFWFVMLSLMAEGAIVLLMRWLARRRGSVPHRREPLGAMFELVFKSQFVLIVLMLLVLMLTGHPAPPDLPRASGDWTVLDVASWVKEDRAATQYLHRVLEAALLYLAFQLWRGLSLVCWACGLSRAARNPGAVAS